MMLARAVFALAALAGFGALIPLYQADGSPAYYGLVGAIAAFQVLYLLIAWQPIELRRAMLPAILEKLFWVSTFAVIYLRGQISAVDLVTQASVHGVLGVLFAAAYYRTRPARVGLSSERHEIL